MLLESTATGVDVEIASTTEALIALEGDWREVWQLDPYATPFDSPAWLIPWTRRFTGGDLACVIVRRETRPIGFVPCFIWLNPETEERQLVLLGTGISDYGGGVFDPAHAEMAARAALDALHEHGGWERLTFEQLGAHSPLLLERRVPQSVCPVVELGPDRDLSRMIPESQAQNLSYYRRRAERIGPVEFEAADEHSAASMLEELFLLNSARWHGHKRAGVLEDDTIKAFHRETAPLLLRAGMLRLYRLTIRSQTAAVLYGFCSHGRTCYYLSGFDLKFAHVSPGTLIIGHAIERAIAEGCTTFDFLRGAERYKYLWGAKDTQTYRLESVRG